MGSLKRNGGRGGFSRPLKCTKPGNCLGPGGGEKEESEHVDQRSNTQTLDVLSPSETWAGIKSLLALPYVVWERPAGPGYSKKRGSAVLGRE